MAKLPVIRGDNLANILSGPNTEKHILLGRDGDDIFYGGYTSGDEMRGGAGNDLFFGGIGNDVFKGGWGWDTVSFANAIAGITVDLAKRGPQDTGFGSDSFLGIESLIGSYFDDRLIGSSRDEQFYGGAGDDKIWGRAGNDILQGGYGDDVMNGGAGRDTVAYWDAESGVNVTLTTTDKQDTGSLGIDRLISIEVLIGSSYDDVLSGDYTDTIFGEGGDDILIGGEIVNSRLFAADLYGGDGDDVLYGFQPTGEQVNLFGRSTGPGDPDRGSILDGGDGNDVIWAADSLTYKVFGGDGDDILNLTTTTGNFMGFRQLNEARGGDGADLFRIVDTDGNLKENGDTAPFASVLLLDFDASEGDRLDVRDFGFTQVDSFSGSGEAEVMIIIDTTILGVPNGPSIEEDRWRVVGDKDGDGVADYFVWLGTDLTTDQSDALLI